MNKSRPDWTVTNPPQPRSDRAPSFRPPFRASGGISVRPYRRHRIPRSLWTSTCSETLWPTGSRPLARGARGRHYGATTMDAGDHHLADGTPSIRRLARPNPKFSASSSRPRWDSWYKALTRGAPELDEGFSADVVPWSRCRPTQTRRCLDSTTSRCRPCRCDSELQQGLSTSTRRTMGTERHLQIPRRPIFATLSRRLLRAADSSIVRLRAAAGSASRPTGRDHSGTVAGRHRTRPTITRRARA